MQRSLLLFQNSINSKETLRVYQYSLDKFLSYFKLRDYDSLVRMDPKMLQQMIEDYVMEKKKQNKARSTIKTPISALELFCDTNDISINWKKINRLLPPLKKKSGSRAYSTEQVKKMLEATTEIRNKALIHFIAASGIRIGALPDLKIKHVRSISDGCKAVTVYPGEREEYITFLTPEASQVLDEYLTKRTQDGENINPESPLFRQVYAFGMAKAKPLKKVSIQAIIDRVLRRAGLRFGRDGTRRDVQLDHGFRKRWNTIVKTTDGIKIILAEKMFGHSTPTIPLDETYVDASESKLFKEYKKAILELTIDDSQRKQILLDTALKEKSELEKEIPGFIEKAVQRELSKLRNEGWQLNKK
ncbi:tyrosine-type recombinase/integrase [Nitrosarchaeum koreense]|nr:tyrosine-type recombinase/integrase [Nitrosarchaeum koreense]